MIKFHITSQSIKNMAVEAVATNGLPLCTFEKSVITKMLAPMLDQLNLKLTASDARAWATRAYQRKMIERKQIFGDIMVSIKVDSCRRRKHHFIGMNFQAVLDGTLLVITAAMNESHERETAAAIRKNTISCSAKFGILEKQIYSLTTNNGSNVSKVGKLMRSDFALPENLLIRMTSMNVM